MSITSGYSLHLYCDIKECGKGEHKHGEFPHEYAEEHAAHAYKYARIAGWRIDKRLCLAVCPRCAKAGFTLKQAAELRDAKAARENIEEWGG